MGRQSNSYTADDAAQAPLFAIADAARLSNLHPQTLRQYDRIGLVVPQRTAGGSRRYSMVDIEQLREVARLSADGVRLTVIERILDMENEIDHLRSLVRALEAELRGERENRPGRRVFSTNSSGSVAVLRAGTRAPRRDALVLVTR